jgi:hypothetical protein
MKYVFLFCNTPEEVKAWERMSEDDRNRAYEMIGKWFGDNQGKVRGGYQLQDASTATSVRKDMINRGQPIITDGPYIESNEVIGGYTEVEVNNLDEALTLAKSWPGGGVEIRPVIEQ